MGCGKRKMGDGEGVLGVGDAEVFVVALVFVSQWSVVRASVVRRRWSVVGCDAP